MVSAWVLIPHSKPQTSYFFLILPFENLGLKVVQNLGLKAKQQMYPSKEMG